MNEGRIATVCTDNCSRFFKGDRVKIIRYIKVIDKYLVQRVEGYIQAEISPEDIRFENSEERI